jgi:transcriptional regulator with XRE-family HTH domain
VRLTDYANRRNLQAVPRKHLTLREARDRRGWSQERLEEETKKVDPKGVGIDQRAISKIECSAVLDPMNSTVVLLETALGVERGTLVFGREAEALAS